MLIVFHTVTMMSIMNIALVWGSNSTKKLPCIILETVMLCSKVGPSKQVLVWDGQSGYVLWVGDGAIDGKWKFWNWMGGKNMFVHIDSCYTLRFSYFDMNYITSLEVA